MDDRLGQISRYLLARSQVAEFNPATIGAKLLPHLFVLGIERDSTENVSGLRIHLAGTALDSIFRRPLKDHRLEEFIHGPRGSDVIDHFHHCANTREPVWMRQIVHLRDKPPRFVEGVAVYLEPERIYGGLVVGESIDSSAVENFEHCSLWTAGLAES